MPLDILIPKSDGAARSNRPGVVPGISDGRSSQTITTIIPAGGSTIISQAGQEFYLVLATGPVLIKPNNGSFNQYVQGTGEIANARNLFNNLQVKNPNTVSSVIISIFVGFGDYIDNRAILFNPLVVNAVYGTYPVTNSLVDILIPDLSQTSITDVNGVSRLALSRETIQVFNLDSGVVINIKNMALTKTVAVVQPLFSATLPMSGDFKIHSPSAMLNCIVSEIYSTVLPSSFVVTS